MGSLGSHPVGWRASLDGLEPPEVLKQTYAAWTWRVVWRYDDAVTYRLSESGDVHFMKLASVEQYPSLPDEAQRTQWAADHLPVADVLGHGAERGQAWLVTRGLPGTDATDPALKADPQRLVPLLAAGLRQFHEAPVASCPFDFRLPAAFRHVRHRLEAGAIVPLRDFHSEFAHLSATEAVDLLERSRPKAEDLVVCHGDYCLPNVLIQDDSVVGFVDLGELGVADRWWDLAVATWSLEWNLGAGHDALFLGEYGVEWDDERARFYRLLYDLVS